MTNNARMTKRDDSRCEDRHGEDQERIINSFSTLTDSDIRAFSTLKIPVELITRANIERVTNYGAREKYGIHSYGDLAGIVFPYLDPANGRRCTVQVGFISYPGGQLQPVTRDTNRYSTLTLSADGKTLATVQAKTTQGLFVVSGGVTRDKTARLILSQSLSQPLGFNWASERELLVSSIDGLVRMGSAGSDRTMLLSDAGIFTPSTCGTRYLVFSLWTGTGTQIWRTDADGSNLVACFLDQDVGIRQTKYRGWYGQNSWYYFPPFGRSCGGHLVGSGLCSFLPERQHKSPYLVDRPSVLNVAEAKWRAAQAAARQTFLAAPHNCIGLTCQLLSVPFPVLLRESIRLLPYR